MIRLLLASELLGPILCSHIDWDCTHSNWILECSVVDVTLRLFILGFEGSLTEKEKKKQGGWVEVRSRGVTFHPDPRLPPLLSLPLQLACLSSRGAFWRVRLGRRRIRTAWRLEFTRYCCCGRALAPSVLCGRATDRLMKRTIFFSFSHICDSHQQKGGLLHL